VKARWPWSAVDLAPHEVSAIKAISPGAFEALEKICGTDRMSFTAGGEDGRRATDFAEGRRWVGNTLRQIREMKMPGPPKEQPNS
jgi:hypothetical protein